jgi:hypothetical protein
MKKWFKSKMLWFNFIIGVGAAIEASLSIIQGYFDPRIYLALIALVSGVNMVLRFISSSQLTK